MYEILNAYRRYADRMERFMRSAAFCLVAICTIDLLGMTSSAFMHVSYELLAIGMVIAHSYSQWRLYKLDRHNV